MLNFYVYFAVIVCGGSVLAIEILGTRIIAPFYGNSLYLWSALISITLAALSVGYAVGGRWADRGPRLERFALVIGLAGLWTSCIPWLRTPALALTESFGLRAAVLITSTVLFFPPLFLLGLVSPYAIRLKASTLNEVGRTAGNLYSLSTVASVVASVCTGFFLIPYIGVSQLMLLIGLLLMATSALGLVIGRRKGPAATALLVVVAGILVNQYAPAATADPERGLLTVKQSPYADIRVVESDGVRYMIIDGGTHTIVDPVTWDSQFPYVNVLDIAREFFDRPGQMLLVGLGGGSVAKRFHASGWKVNSVEIDPVVIEFAYSHFGLRAEESSIVEMDARQHLITNENRYDLIVMDAFGSSSIPFHLVTTEAFALVKSRLNPDGVLAMNIEAIGWDSRIVKSLASTLHTQFEHVVVLPIAEPPSEIGNLILCASTRRLDIPSELPLPQGRFTPEYDRRHAWDNRFSVDESGIQVFTDELNPVDLWTESVNLRARKELHAYFKDKGVTW